MERKFRHIIHIAQIAIILISQLIATITNTQSGAITDRAASRVANPPCDPPRQPLCPVVERKTISGDFKMFKFQI